MSKRFYLLVSLILLVGVVFSGCAPQANTAETNNEEVEAEVEDVNADADAEEIEAEVEEVDADAEADAEEAEAEVEETEADVEETEAEAAAGLAITGLVETEQSWTEAEVLEMETMDVESTNKDGEAETYTGVSIAALLDLAVPTADAATIVFVADDGYTAEAALEDVLACEDGIISFRNQGGFSVVLPGMDGSLQVKGVIEIQVQ